MGDKEKEVPFTAVADANGKLMVSFLGLPSSSDEVPKFMQMVKQGAPKITPSDLSLLEAQVRNTFEK